MIRFYLYSPVVFFYFFSVEFIYAPFGLGTRALIGCVGLIYLAFNFLVIKFTINKKLFLPFFLIGLLLVLSSVSLIANDSDDLYFLKYPLSILLIVSAAYFIVSTAPNYRNYTKFESVLAYLILVGIYQAIIALSMFFYPPVFDALNSIQSISDFDKNLIETFLEYRLLGFGANFFTLGIFYSISVLSVSYFIKCRYGRSTSIALLLIIFFIFTLVGLSMSRSTLIGFVFALIFLLVSKNNYRDKSTFRMSGESIIVTALILVASVVGPIIYYTYLSHLSSPLFNFAFELFINLFEQGRLESASTSHLLTMYDVDIGWKTFIIGDAQLFETFDRSIYYKETDVGYIRLILYFGFPGLLTYLLLQATPCFYIYKTSTTRPVKIYSVILFLIFIALNFKGLVDIITYTSVLAIAHFRTLKACREIKSSVCF